MFDFTTEKARLWPTGEEAARLISRLMQDWAGRLPFERKAVTDLQVDDLTVVGRFEPTPMSSLLGAPPVAVVGGVLGYLPETGTLVTFDAQVPEYDGPATVVDLDTLCRAQVAVVDAPVDLLYQPLPERNEDGSGFMCFIAVSGEMPLRDALSWANEAKGSLTLEHVADAVAAYYTGAYDHAVEVLERACG